MVATFARTWATVISRTLASAATVIKCRFYWGSDPYRPVARAGIGATGTSRAKQIAAAVPKLTAFPLELQLPRRKLRCI